MGFGLAISSLAGGCQIEDPARTDVDRMLPALCERAEPCRCAAEQDSEECLEVRGERWDARLAYARDEGLIYDSSCIDTIIADVEAIGCGDAIDEDEHLCTSFCAVFHGSRQLGESCESHDASTSDCAQGTTCLEGTCVPPCEALRGLARGEVCRDENGNQFDECAANLRCDWDSRACIRLPDLGEACRETDCAEGAYCDWDRNRCVARSQEGQSCRNSECALGLQCDWDQDRCRRPGSIGDSCINVTCQEDLGCQQGVCGPLGALGENCENRRCGDGLWCDWQLGRCAAFPDGQGQPCPAGECAGRLWCDTSQDPEGECQLRIPDGDPCSGHSQCDSSYCPAGFCVPLPLEGESCADTQSCANGLTCDGAVCIEAVSRGSALCSFEGW